MKKFACLLLIISGFAAVALADSEDLKSAIVGATNLAVHVPRDRTMAIVNFVQEPSGSEHAKVTVGKDSDTAVVLLASAADGMTSAADKAIRIAGPADVTVSNASGVKAFITYRIVHE